jgi:protein-tyrosine phosphatase
LQRIRPWLSIGKYAETKNRQFLETCQINAMLQLAEAVQQPCIPSLYLPIEDGKPIDFALLKQGIEFGREQKAAGHHLLVACGAGISRSVAFAIAVLKEEEKLSLLDAYRVIKQAHPGALPHYALWDSLCEYYGEQTPYIDIFDA